MSINKHALLCLNEPWLLMFFSCFKRILMVRQTGVTLSELAVSDLVNGSLVKMVTKSLIPPSHHRLLAPEVAEAIESSLQMPQGDWPSWTVRHF